MPPVAVVPRELRQGVFRGSAAVTRGLLTPNQLRGPAWRRLFEDVYVHVDRPVSHALRARAAAAMVVPGSVVTGHSAAVLWGVDLAGPEDAVELTSLRPRTLAASPVFVSDGHYCRSGTSSDDAMWRPRQEQRQR